MRKAQLRVVGKGFALAATSLREEPHRHIRALRPTQPGTDRRVALSRLLALWPHELEDETAEARLRILGRLRKALRAERRRGLAGHWTYDLARHIELLRLYRAERAILAHQLAGIAKATAVQRLRESRNS
jgi:hypothetical protein